MSTDDKSAAPIRLPRGIDRDDTEHCVDYYTADMVREIVADALVAQARPADDKSAEALRLCAEALAEIVPSFNTTRMIMDSREARDEAGEMVLRGRAAIAAALAAQAQPAPVRPTPLSGLRGMAAGALGSESSEAYVERVRGEGWAQAAPAAPSEPAAKDAEIVALRQRAERAEADAGRLDWLEAQVSGTARVITSADPDGYRPLRIEWGEVETAGDNPVSVREAIDAALAASQADGAGQKGGAT